MEMSVRVQIASVILMLVLALQARPSELEMGDMEIAAGKFLVASNYHMSDPKFKTSVILLVRHDPEKGTLGLILNHPTRMNVHEALPGISEAQHVNSTVYLGGPVAMRSFTMLVRTNEPADGLTRVLSSVSFSADMDAMTEWLARESRPNRIRIFAGYSGWGAGQLAAEMQMRGWRLLPADARSVFEISPENLWPELTGRQPTIRTAIPDEWPPPDPWPLPALQEGDMPQGRHSKVSNTPAGTTPDPGASFRTAGR